MTVQDNCIVESALVKLVIHFFILIPWFVLMELVIQNVKSYQILRL